MKQLFVVLIQNKLNGTFNNCQYVFLTTSLYNRHTHMWRFGATRILASPLFICGNNKKQNKNATPQKFNLILRCKYSVKPHYDEVLKIFMTLKSCADRNGAQAPHQPCSELFCIG